MEPFCIPSLELFIPLNCCKSTVSKTSRHHETRMFSRLFQSHKMHLLALLGHFQTDMTDFSPFSCTSTSEITTLSWKLKNVPLLGGASSYRQIGIVYILGGTFPPSLAFTLASLLLVRLRLNPALSTAAGVFYRSLKGRWKQNDSEV